MKQHKYFSCNWFHFFETMKNLKEIFIYQRNEHRLMPKFTILISIVILIVALVLLFVKLFTPQPIQITLQSGQESTTSTSEYFSFVEVLLLIASAFLIGTTATYLFYNSDRTKTIKLPSQKPEFNANVYEAILPLLKTGEKQVIAALRENNGEIKQNKLAAKLGVSKVKATRILYGLEQKRLITKERHGLTNNIKLEKNLYKE